MGPTKRAGIVVWFAGLPSSGKSSLATHVGEELALRGVLCVMLDGDKVRDCLVPRPGYSAPERDAFYDTLGRIAALMAAQGHVVLVPATAHKRRYREEARKQAPAFLEVFMDVPLEEAMLRDQAKGLYAHARGNMSATLPGVGVAYEAPLAPDVVARGGKDVEAAKKILALVEARGAGASTGGASP